MVQWAGPIFSWPITQKQFREHIKTGKTRPATLYPFVLINRNRVVGYCELSRYCRNTNQATLSRFIVSPKNHNQGMATFMINEILRFGFNRLNLNRIGLGVFDFNETAIGCYSKAGFILEGTLRESAKVGDAYWNCHLMSILRKEWKG
jgi:RimJ/RimL family protein N-acetyltransferase